MSVYKRVDSENYWYKFMFNGRLIARSAKVKNKREAEKIEAAYRTLLANGEVGLEDQTPAPTLREFAQKFDFVQTRHSNKPETVRFYANRLKRLLEWETWRDTRLDRIDESLIARYIGVGRKKVGVVSVNRELATLRRALHLALEWKLIRAVPKVKLLPGEESRNFILDHATEQRYFEGVPPLLRDVATVLRDSGLRLGEALALQWSDVHLEPVGSARYGWLQVRDGKSKSAKRTVPLVARLASLLKEKKKTASSEWVFAGESPDKPILGTSLAHMHTKVCRPGKGKSRKRHFPADLVLHSLRHTALTR